MKTQINAELLLASKNSETGDILYTFRLTYPRIILAEFNTHRAFSRNTSSSRAIPGKRTRKVVRETPFVPTHIGAAQKGMQAGDELTGWRRAGVELIWKTLRFPNLLGAWAMEKLGAHKQIANRVLEPWLWVTQIASATDVNNFLKLRAHEMAEPHFSELAQQVKDRVQYVEGMLTIIEWVKAPLQGGVQILKPGEWHLPLITEEERNNGWTLKGLKLISAARCARTSYTLVGDGKVPDIHKDIALGEKLVSADPIHASPLEHQARASSYGRWANFRGFMQFRHEIEGERGGDAL